AVGGGANAGSESAGTTTPPGKTLAPAKSPARSCRRTIRTSSPRGESRSRTTVAAGTGSTGMHRLCEPEVSAARPHDGSLNDARSPTTDYQATTQIAPLGERSRERDILPS